MRDGALEVEFRNSEEATKALSATRFVYSEGRASGRKLVSLSLTVEPHRSKNSSRGVINCFDLRNVSDDDIADGLSEYGVTAARRILTRRGTVPTNNIILTFDTTDMPNEVRVGYIKVRVRPYVPAPMRCYRCQRFGHTKDNCRGRPTCSKCASQDHTDDTCNSETPRCVNCGEGQTPHSAYDRSCPTYVKEKEINTIKATRNLSFKEAREVYNQTHPKTSYAQKCLCALLTVGSILQCLCALLTVSLLVMLALGVALGVLLLTSVYAKPQPQAIPLRMPDSVRFDNITVEREGQARVRAFQPIGTADDTQDPEIPQIRATHQIGDLRDRISILEAHNHPECEFELSRLRLWRPVLRSWCRLLSG
ncbi:Nucleic-acid-binding protein from mobile element jockey [Amphibalanus amphitrite]|uniref:Nucleic-acid-binding protein from mobile element jockey n=1 Tax=Amphibalanus amphitrite TaxID=1232801 RepID=A0A6A4WXJ0_AMPAM|nr:Nucleic-acid-binding protein from mobile element jockey [Amphibalanus amphitrite]